MIRKPHAVQIAALNASRGHFGFAYYMEQGLGKTATTYMDFLEQLANGNATRMIVVCPNSFKGGWVDEAAEWGFDFDFYIYQAGDEWGQQQFLKKKFDKPPVVIINYESIRPKVRKVGKKKVFDPNAGIDFLFKFMAPKPTMFAIDESILVSTYDALQTMGVIMVADKIPSTSAIRLLSGKPIKQGPHDLWSQMRILRNMTMNYFVFKNNFCKMGGFKGHQVVGSMNEEALAEIIDPVVFRATKEEWTDLPPKVPNIREYQLTPAMAEYYRSMEEDFVVWLNEEKDEYVTIEAALTKYIKLAQIQAGFIFDENKVPRLLVEPEKNPRLALLETILRDEVPGKAVVVYNHRPVRDMLSTRFEKLRPVFIHGGMTDEAITESKRVFNTDRSNRVIFITKAAKYGHTLLGLQDTPDDACADMVFYENTYSLDDRSQLEDRPHRHGQEQEFMRYWDLVGTDLDKNAVKALQRKESIFQAVFSKLRQSRA